MNKVKSNDHLRQLARNPRLLFWGKALLEINAINAVVTIFYLHRGLRLDQIFYLSIVWSITALVLEVPTGYLADRLGRKRTLLLGAFMLAATWGVMFLAHSFWAFVLVFLMMSASFACFSGTEEALLYDTLKELKLEKETTRHSGAMHSATSLFNIFMPALGAFIARDLTEAQFGWLLAINTVTALAGLAVWLQLREPKHVDAVASHEKNIFRHSLITIRQNPVLLYLALNKLLIFIATFITWRAYQPFLQSRGLSAVGLGVFYIFFHTVSFLIKRNAGRLEARLGTQTVLNGSVVVMVVSLLVVVLSPWVLLSAVCAIMAMVVTGAREPVFTHLVNQRVHSRSRATTLSNLNVLKSVLDIPILWLSGTLALVGLEYVFVVAMVLGLSTLLFFRIRYES